MHNDKQNRRIELLAPAGNMEAFWAAMGAGADAVYLGGAMHNARLGCDNFSLDQLARTVEYARVRERRVYLAVNTLIDHKEFPALMEYIYKVKQLHVDALIIQDLGLLFHVREKFPDLRVHASTQMFIHNTSGLRFLGSAGVKRAVLARELSLEEISRLNQADTGVETEVFVHGALCYCLSGLCLFSSMVGGRSANRGRCAQPCRLAYRLLADGQYVEGEKGSHALSMADLCAIDLLGRLKDSGVSSLKIEGRMKRPEYVAVITAHYRQALDALEKSGEDYDCEKARREMARVFNRRFTSAYLDGSRRSLVSSHRSNNRGVYAGRVMEQGPGFLTRIKLAEPLVEGDGLVVWTREKPAAVVAENIVVDGENRKHADPGELAELELRQKVAPNDRVFKTHDRELIDYARDLIEKEKARRIGVRARLVFREGQALTIVLQDENGRTGEASSRNTMVKAEKTPLPPEIIAEKVSKTGNTPFELVELRIDGPLDLFIPLSDLNETRRRAFESLMAGYFPDREDSAAELPGYTEPVLRPVSEKQPGIEAPRGLLSVMTMYPEQAYAAIEGGASRIYMKTTDFKGRRISEEAIASVCNEARRRHVDFFLALPWFSPEDAGPRLESFCQTGITRFLVGNLGDLADALKTGGEVAVDFNLNIFNKPALQFLLGQGVVSVCLSAELNAGQIKAFSSLSGTETIVHGDLPVMVSRCCILGDDLPRGQQNCRAACRQGAYTLEDQKGYRFPLEFDGDCMQYTYNSRSASAVEDMPGLKNHMPAWLRLQLERYRPEQIEGLLALWMRYTGLIQQKAEIPRSVVDEYREAMQALSTMPITRGHWHRGILDK